jgi:hypothetical protein
MPSSSNLALAVFWLFLGIGTLVVEQIRGDSLFGEPIIWLCLVLAAYNTIRVLTQDTLENQLA